MMISDQSIPAVRPHPRKMLVAGLYSPGSGLTNVLTVLLRELQRDFVIQGYGFQPQLGCSNTDIEIASCPVHVDASSRPVFLADPAWLSAYMANNEPDCVLVSGSAFLAGPLLAQMQKYRARTKILLYLPVEGELTNPEITRILSLTDVCVLYTACARQNAIDLCRQAAAADPLFRTPLFYVVGHGVDASRFRPLSGSPGKHFPGCNRAAWKRRLFPDRPELHDSFLVLNANCAYQRKRLDLTVDGFVRFARTNSDSYLYLHTGRLPQGQDALQMQIQNSGVAERILVNALNPDGARLPLEKLNLLYNACDVGLTTAMGEGWGLASFEHAATGAPQIVPDHTSFRENWSGAAVMIPAHERCHIFYEFADMFAVDGRDVATALDRLYRDRDYYRHMAGAAYKRTIESRFQWTSVGQIFRGVLSQVLT